MYRIDGTFLLEMGHSKSTQTKEEVSLVLDQVVNKLNLLGLEFADIFIEAEQATNLKELQVAFTNVNDVMCLFMGLKQDSKSFEVTKASILKLCPSERFKKQLNRSGSLKSSLAGWKVELVEEISILDSLRKKNDEIRNELNYQDKLLINGNIKSQELRASSPNTSRKRRRSSLSPNLGVSSPLTQSVDGGRKRRKGRFGFSVNDFQYMRKHQICFKFQYGECRSNPCRFRHVKV